MDGLLLDTERMCVRAFNEVVDGFGLPEMQEVAFECIGQRADGVKNTVERALAGRVTFQEFNESWDGLIAKAFDDGISLKSGVVELLDALQRQRIPCAVATSTRTESALRHLKNANLLRYFGCVIGGDKVVSGKPKPDIYHMAAKTIEVSASDCVAFEDSDLGALAAIRSGAVTVQVPDLKPSGLDVDIHGHVIATSLLDGARKTGLIP